MTDYLYDLSSRINEINEKSGFNEYATTPDEYKALYIGNKLMLVSSELAEAQDELRTGHSVHETYYPAGPVPASLAVEFASGAEAQEYWQNLHNNKQSPKKPEGFPSEIADAIIRLLSLGRELGIDLPAIIEEKVAYNATREYRHGKKF